MEELEDTKEICVDTDILIDFLKKKEPGSITYKQWKKKSSVGITSITAFELLMGVRLPGYSKNEKRFEEVQSLIDQQDTVYSFDRNAADVASEVESELRGTGKTINFRDLINASICISRKVPILTRNKAHYQRVRALQILDIQSRYQLDC